MADLERFVIAQEPVYEAVLGDLRRGRKTTHWMWFIFPQIAGLGRSEVSSLFAIASLDEARAYLSHPLLGARLRECSATVLAVPARTAKEIFGPIDAMKLRSSRPLVHRAAPEEAAFVTVLDRYFAGVTDAATDALLGSRSDAAS